MGFNEHNGITFGEGPTVHMVADERVRNASGSMHGGMFVALLDSAMGRAIRLQVGEGPVILTMQLSSTFLHKAHLGDELVATGEVVRLSRRTAFANGELVRASDGQVLAQAQGTFALRHLGGVGGGVDGSA